MELRWRPDRTASCLHAVAALWRGEALVDASLAAELSEAASVLRETLELYAVEAEEFFAHAIPLASGVSLRELAQGALAKAAGLAKAELCAADVSSQLAHLQAVFDRAVPGVAEQLRLRVEPLRLQWEARGPGMLAALGRMVGPDVLVEQATVILVQPVRGGGGQAHHRYNAVHFEAVLTNPLAELPEVVRLGWLLAQLNLDLPVHQANLARDRLLTLGSLALATAALFAAAEVELARADEPTLRTALEAWGAAPADANAADVSVADASVADSSAADTSATPQTVATLFEWWDVYRQQPPSLRVALEALDLMLG